MWTVLDAMTDATSPSPQILSSRRNRKQRDTATRAHAINTVPVCRTWRRIRLPSWPPRWNRYSRRRCTRPFSWCRPARPGCRNLWRSRYRRPTLPGSLRRTWSGRSRCIGNCTVLGGTRVPGRRPSVRGKRVPSTRVPGRRVLGTLVCRPGHRIGRGR